MHRIERQGNTPHGQDRPALQRAKAKRKQGNRKDRRKSKQKQPTPADIAAGLKEDELRRKRAREKAANSTNSANSTTSTQLN